MKPIKSRINRIKWLRDGCKALLIEVCELHEAGKGGCWASNKRLAERLGCDVITISRRVATLYKAGLITSKVIEAQGNRRIIAPAPPLQAAYKADTDELVDALTIVSLGDTTKPTIVESDSDYSQKSKATIVRNVLDYSRFRGDLTKNKEEQKRKSRIRELEAVVAAAHAAADENEKKIGELEKENQALKAELLSLTAQRPAAHTKAAAALVFPEWATPAFRAGWDEWVAYRQSKRDKLKPASLQKMLNQLAAFDEAYCQQLFDKAIASGYTGLVFADTPQQFAKYLQAQQPGYDNTAHYRPQNGVAAYGQRPAPAVHTNPFGRAAPESLAIARAVVVGSTGDYPGLI